MEILTHKQVFVTVGTTKFEKLIQEASSPAVLNALSDLGYTKVVFQTGNGAYERTTHPNLVLQYREYFENFEEQIEQASLVISHGGAGTCLEVLRKQRPLIVVINEGLMNNHQVELAEELQSRGFLYYCTCKDLEKILKNKSLRNLKTYESVDGTVFSSYVDECMGFV